MIELQYLDIIGIVLILLVFNKLLAQKFRYPEVTGAIIIGIIIGVSWLDILNYMILNSFSDLTFIAVGIMAFGFGSELNRDNFQQVRFIPVFIVIFESLLTFFSVFLGMYYILNLDLSLSLIMGTIAAGTTPGATMNLLKQFRAKGRITTSIMTAVGLDNIMAFFIYTVVISLVKSDILLGNTSFLNLLIAQYGIYFKSILTGVLFGLFMYFFLQKFKADQFVGITQFALITLNVAICRNFEFYIPLSLLFFGLVVANLDRVLILKGKRALRVTNEIILYTFFIFAGANLNMSLIYQIGYIGFFYFFLRSFGKIAGTYLGASISKAEIKIRDNLGFALMPQIGVALTLALSTQNQLSSSVFGETGQEIGKIIVSVVIFTTILTEIIGPITTTHVLKKNGEITKK